MPKLAAPTAKPIRLRAIRPNAGVEAAYRRKLQRMVAEMAGSYRYWLSAAWKRTAPIAQDQSHTVNLNTVMRKLGRRWRRNFDRVAEDMAKHFASGSSKHIDVAMMAALKQAGFTVTFSGSTEVFESARLMTVQNVSLIKSIPQKFHAQVETHVWRAVSKGGDLAALTELLEKQFHVTHERAALIARDQNAKANAAFERVRRKEMGIQKAIWRHTGASREPRQSHEKAHGKEFDIEKGCLIDGEYIHPGELIHCGCTSEAIIPGLEVIGNY